MLKVGGGGGGGRWVAHVVIGQCHTAEERARVRGCLPTPTLVVRFVQ